MQNIIHAYHSKEYKSDRGYRVSSIRVGANVNLHNDQIMINNL